MTWVVSDYTATPGTTEVSVTKGQQVEIIDTSSGAPEFCLVRLTAKGGSGEAGTQEGLVPLSVLKPAPSSKSVHRRAIDGIENKEHTESNGKFFQSIANLDYFHVLIDKFQWNVTSFTIYRLSD